MTESASRTTEQKVGLFRRFFIGLTHVYGTYDARTGRGRQVKRPVTDAVIVARLQGKQHYGVYLLDGDRTGAVVADFDVNDLDPPREFVAGAWHYGLLAGQRHAFLLVDEARPGDSIDGVLREKLLEDAPLEQGRQGGQIVCDRLATSLVVEPMATPANEVLSAREVLDLLAG